MSKTTFVAAGDIFITRRIPREGYEGFDKIKALIEKHDVKFANLESTFHDQEGIPAVVSGGTWAMSDPRTLDDIARYGFNIYNTANNHSGDYSYGGILATIRNLKERDMLFSGTGKDLGEASKPCYLETKDCRVALISCNASNEISAMAGGQTCDMVGRPGLNPLRFTRLYHVEQKYFDMIKELSAATKVNAAKERSIANGYSMPFKEGTYPLGATNFVLDDRCFVESIPNKQDMERIENEIREAKRQADVVLVSFHSHNYDYDDATDPSQYLKTFARRCIDAGATAILGHGPHQLQGIEIYKGGVIFYSLGNFLFETETVEYQPWDAYANRGMPLDTKVGAYMDERSKNGTAGYGVQPEIWRAILGGFTMEDGKITQVQLHPISLGMELHRSRKGVPVLSGDEDVLHYLQKLSEPYGTKIEIKDGVGTIKMEA